MKKVIGLALLMAGTAYATLSSNVTSGGALSPIAVVNGIVGGATSTTAINTAGGTTAATSITPGVPLQDFVYFGAVWQLLNEDAGSAPIVLANGYANARVDRTSDSKFFAGIVEKLDASGRVTDVIVAFAGAQGAADLVQGETLAQGIVLDEPNRAAALFETLWNDPRYAGAKLHVTGHSLGAGYAQFVGAEAIAAHGFQAVANRVNFVAFGVPNWGPQSAKHFGLDPHVLDPLFTGYTALNDPVITNGGTDRVGVNNFMPPFLGLPLAFTALNSVAAHFPTAYVTALGLPNWLSQADKDAYCHDLNDRFVTKNSFDRDAFDVLLKDQLTRVVAAEIERLEALIGYRSTRVEPLAPSAVNAFGRERLAHILVLRREAHNAMERVGSERRYARTKKQNQKPAPHDQSPQADPDLRPHRG